jgi:hypothetical protein
VSDELRSVLLGTAGLGVVAVVALALTLARAIGAGGPELRRAVRMAAATALLQAGHFAEELATGFPVRFPDALGLAPWPPGFFVSFNLVWLAIWGASVQALARRRRAALFPLWFLGLAGAVNGIVHPLLALRAGSYFPGLVSAPLLGVAGVWLLGRLWRVTAAGASSAAPPASP